MQELYRIIEQDPRFDALQRSRSRYAWTLAATVMGAYYTFVAIIAFVPGVFARTLSGDTVVTVGLLAALAVIILSILVTALYIVRANRDFDRVNQSIVDDATRAARR